MKKILVNIQDELGAIDQHFKSIICTPFFKFDSKSSGIEIYLDNPPALPSKTDHIYVVP